MVGIFRNILGAIITVSALALLSPVMAMAGTATSASTPSTSSTQPQSQSSKMTISKAVRRVGDSAWQPVVTASARLGDSLEYRIIVTNTGGTPLNNLRIRDALPAGLSLEGQNLRGSAGVSAFTAAQLTSAGVTVSTLPPGGSIEIVFTAKIENPASPCNNGGIHNVASVAADGAPAVEDFANASICSSDSAETTQSTSSSSSSQTSSTTTEPPEESAEPSSEEAPTEEEQATLPQTESAATDTALPATGVSAEVAFLITGVLGAALYELKRLYAHLV